VHENLPPFIDAARQVHRSVKDVRFLVASFNEDQRRHADGLLANSDLPVELHVGRTPEIIRLATVCISVSGSVGLELLHQALPSVVYYQVTPMQMLSVRLLMKARWISLINLLAGQEIAPELMPARPDGAAAAGHLIHWLTDEAARAKVQRKMELVRDMVAQPGACDRAADYILRALSIRDRLESKAG
jgi:lipid-A-disaccharide synthase